MRTPRRGAAKWSRSVLMAASVFLAGTAAQASEALYVGARPAPVKERPTARAAVVTTIPSGTMVQVFDRQDGWCWVVVPTGPSSEPITNGWVRQEWLVANGPDWPGEHTAPAGETAAAPPPVAVVTAPAAPVPVAFAAAAPVAVPVAVPVAAPGAAAVVVVPATGTVVVAVEPPDNPGVQPSLLVAAAEEARLPARPLARPRRQAIPK